MATGLGKLPELHTLELPCFAPGAVPALAAGEFPALARLLYGGPLGAKYANALAKAKFPALVAFVNHIGQQNWSIILLVFVLGILSWPSLARMVRGQVLSLREQEFMEACEALGIRDRSRIFRHIMPPTTLGIDVQPTGWAPNPSSKRTREKPRAA